MKIPYFRLGQYGVTVERIEYNEYTYRFGENPETIVHYAFEPEVPSAYGRLTIAHQDTKVSTVAFYFGWVTLSPQIVLVPESQSLLLGVENTICAISAPQGYIEWIFTLPHILYILLLLQETDLLYIAVHELGVVGILPTGQKAWSYDTDIVAHFEINKSVLTLVDMEGNAIHVNLRDGEHI